LAGARERNCLDAAFHQIQNLFGFKLGVKFTAGHNHLIRGLAHALLKTSQALGKDGVGQRGDHNTNRARPIQHECSGAGIRDIAQSTHSL